MTTSPVGALAPSVRRVDTGTGHLHVNDYPGTGPAVVMMHGFPDDSRIYDRLAPLLPPRRVVTFDWLGYGRSDRSGTGHAADHQRELGAVLDILGLHRVVLAAHDASGPDAIGYTLRNPGRVAHLVLFNTYYGHAPALRFPEMIRLLADPEFAPLADAMLGDTSQRLWLLSHTARQFGADPLDPNGVGVVSVLPQFFGDDDQPDALTAIRGWTRALFPALDQQDAQITQGRLAAAEVPVTLIFGARDPYLGPGLGQHLAGLFQNAQVHLVNDASHWPQWDQPEAVARLIHQALA